MDPIDDIFTESSGSGETEPEEYNPAVSMTTSGANIPDFQNITYESPGQLYAYYYSNTSVVLGTWSAIFSQNVSLAAGVLEVTDDVYYVCEAENFPERNDSGISTTNVTVKVKKRKFNSP